MTVIILLLFALSYWKFRDQLPVAWPWRVLYYVSFVFLRISQLISGGASQLCKSSADKVNAALKNI